MPHIFNRIRNDQIYLFISLIINLFTSNKNGNVYITHKMFLQFDNFVIWYELCFACVANSIFTKNINLTQTNASPSLSFSLIRHESIIDFFHCHVNTCTVCIVHLLIFALSLRDKSYAIRIARDSFAFQFCKCMYDFRFIISIDLHIIPIILGNF